MAKTMKIKTRKDLELFRDLVNSGKINLDGELKNDIDLGGEEWTPIGLHDWENDDIPGYAGRFDGAGHTISGVHINNPEADCVGLFSELINGACVQNLTVRGEVTGNQSVGGITGSMDHSYILNCNNYVRCDGRRYIAGICGYNNIGDIIGCVNYADISGQHTFGISGTLIYGSFKPLAKKFRIQNCRNEGRLFISDAVDISSVFKNDFKYNQIGGDVHLDHSNQQAGEVLFEDNNSLVGMYAKTYHFWDGLDGFSKLLTADPNTKYTNDKGETYLHLLCQNQYLLRNADNLAIMITKLAAETNIDFGAKDHNGKRAETFLRQYPDEDFNPVIKLIKEIRNDRERLCNDEQDETFSEIGF